MSNFDLIVLYIAFLGILFAIMGFVGIIVLAVNLIKWILPTIRASHGGNL